MKILIIYDSVFGNTKQIAQAIGNTFSSEKNIKTIHINDVKPEYLIGLDLLIVGSPTRSFRPTEVIKRFLNKLSSNSLNGISVAAFDTRFSLNHVEPKILRFMVKIGGYAARPITKKLLKKGGEFLQSPEGFIVTGVEGPLKIGELERAENWARLIISKYQQS